MAQLNNLIVTGSSRFLNKVYFSNGGTFNGNLNVINNGDININSGNLQLYGRIALQGFDSWLRINEPKHFTSGIYCGNGTLRTDGEFQVGANGDCFIANSSAITCNRSLIVNAGVDFGYGATIRNAGLELYFTTPFIDFHFNNSNNDFTSRIIESKESVLSINGVTCSSSNLTANNVSATNVNVSTRINADAATAIFNNVYVKDELRSTTWAIDNITNLGSTFYVSPCIIFTNPSVYINSKSGTTVTLTITDNNIISSTIGGQTWTSGSKIKLMGRINTSVLGVVNGTMARQLNTTTAKTAYITLNFATTDDCAGIEQGNANTYGNYGFKLVADGNNNPWFQHSPQRDIPISPVDYNSYKCNGGEWFRIEFEFASTVQATTTDSYGANTYVNINIGLYGKKTNGASCWFIPFGGRSNSSGTVQKVSTAVQLDSDVRSFSVCIQCAGSGTFSGTLKIRNVSVYRMMGNELIVDGAITAAKIKSGEVTSDKIATGAITSTKINVSQLSAISANLGSITGGSINIGNGKFKVDSSGNFTATNGSLTGTVNATTMRAKQNYSVYSDTFDTYQKIIEWSGQSGLNIGLIGDGKTSGASGANIILYGKTIYCYDDLSVLLNLSVGKKLVAETISASIITATDSLSVDKTSTFKGATTFNSTLTCTSTSTFSGTATFTGSLKAGSFTFRDYSETDDNNIIFRRPVASAGSDKSRVAILQGSSNNKIIIKAQYNSTSFANATFTGSSSDIRLKRDIKDSSVNALSKIMQMQIREFNWKQTGIHQELGCVADELELIDPLLTTGGGYDDDGTMNIKSIDTLLLSEYAIKGIQELYRQNKQQQKRIEYLESQLKNK